MFDQTDLIKQECFKFCCIHYQIYSCIKSFIQARLLHTVDSNLIHISFSVILPKTMPLLVFVYASYLTLCKTHQNMSFF